MAAKITLAAAKIILAAAEMDLGGRQDRIGSRQDQPWQLPRSTLAAAKIALAAVKIDLGSCQDRLGSFQDRPWRLPRSTLAAAKIDLAAAKITLAFPFPFPHSLLKWPVGMVHASVFLRKLCFVSHCCPLLTLMSHSLRGVDESEEEPDAAEAAWYRGVDESEEEPDAADAAWCSTPLDHMITSSGDLLQWYIHSTGPLRYIYIYIYNVTFLPEWLWDLLFAWLLQQPED